MNENAPIVIFTYNRPEHLSKCISSLRNCKIAKQSDLLIFSDGPKNEKDIPKVLDVRKIIHGVIGFRSLKIFENEKNLGLASSVIKGVSSVFEEYDKAIILEDDLVVSVDFLEYMNAALNFYQSKKAVFSISGYCAPIKTKSFRGDTFFLRRINSWGWGTWKDRWKSVDWEVKDFDSFISSCKQRKSFNQGGEDLSMMLLKYKLGQIDSWAIRFNYACFKQKKINLYPAKSKILNIGIDNTGTHTTKTKKFDGIIHHGEIKFTNKIEEDDSLLNAYYKFLKPSIFRRTINKYKIWNYLRKKRM